MTKKNLMPAIVLTAICVAAALLLSLINLITAPIIKDRENKEAFASLEEVLPGGSNFAPITLNESYPQNVSEAYSADVGYVFRTVGAGRNGDIVVMVGVSLEGKITGTKIIASEETAKYADPAYEILVGASGAYNGVTMDNFEPIIVGGSTLTSDGYAGAIEAALKAFIVAEGGTVDNRTPEQILQENCNAALGTENVTFTKWFKVASVSSVDAVYESAEGRVYLIGDAFVGIKDGMVVTADASEENKSAALLADVIVTQNTLTEIAKPDGASRTIKKVYLSTSGSYVFEITTTGYEYGHGDLMIKLSISADGKIIDCLTVSHGESKGYGDKCATEEYYESWRGVTADEVVISVGPLTAPTDPGAIAGATQTSNGYQKAVQSAFKAFELLKGGNE